MNTNSQKAFLAAISENWEEWKTDQRCYECDILLSKLAYHHCRHCGYLFCTLCAPNKCDVKKKGETMKDVYVCLYCERIIKDYKNEHRPNAESFMARSLCTGTVSKKPISGGSVFLSWKTRLLELNLNQRYLK